MARSAFAHDVVGLPDPFRRCRVPKDLETVTTVAAESDPSDVAMTRDGIEAIWSSVENLYKSGIHPAIALCVRRKGEVVIDRAIGHASGNGPQDAPDVPKVLATPDTPFCIFSASKGTTATLIHLLDERRLLHTGDPVAEYLPEFARNGKAYITIAHLLAHRAAIPQMPKESLDLDHINDVDRLRELIYDLKPNARAGKRQAYHAVTGGNILGEVVREVTGKDIRDVLADEILDPLGFKGMNFGMPAERVGEIALNYPTGPVPMPPLSTMLTRALGIHIDEAARLSNDPRFQTACLPAANGISNANELGRFYEMLRLGGELDGIRVMEERTIRRARIEQSHMQVDFSLGLPIGFSQGFMLGGKVLSLYGPNTQKAFGHLGFMNIIGWADPERDISAGLITTGKSAIYPDVIKFWEITHQIGKQCAPD